MALEEQRGISERVDAKMREHLRKHHGAGSVRSWHATTDPPQPNEVLGYDAESPTGFAFVSKNPGDGGPTNAQYVVLALHGDLTAEVLHNALTGAQLHAPADHTVASHSDTGATGAELEELTNGSATTLHSHIAYRVTRAEFVIMTADETGQKCKLIVPAGTIAKVEALICGSGTCGATSAIFDIHKIAAANKDSNGVGTTIYTTQGNRPTISNTHRYTNAAAPDVTSLAEGDALVVFVDQAGTDVDDALLIVEITRS